MARIRVLGLGNVLMGDDALGPYVIRVLEAAFEPPEGVQFQDVGTPGLDLIPYLADAASVIVVDTVRGDGAGRVRRFGRDQILEHLSRPRLTPHDPGIAEALLALSLAGAAPRDLLLIGVVPERTGTGAGLSPSVRAAVPAVVEEVVRAIEERGCRLGRRVPPASPDIWWEKAADAEEAPVRGSACTR